MSWTQGHSSLSEYEVGGLEPQSDLAKEAPDQFGAARDAAAAIVRSGVVGDPAEHRFNVTMSGHSNPGHDPAEGYGPDSVSVSVSQAYQPKDPA